MILVLEMNSLQGIKKKFPYDKILPYAVGGVITMVILLIVYAVNGIYPFGSGSVVCDDMVQQSISNYTYFWDYLHAGGGKSLLFNWETAAGTQVLTTGFYILKPWEIIFTLLCSRDGIVNGIPFLIIFKMMMATLSMTFFLRREFKIEPFWQTALSIAYSFSAFILIYYTNMGWIDAAFMFPFLIAALLHMFKTGKWAPYFLLLTYNLLLSIYISYMIFMFLFLIGFLYLALIQPKDTRKMTIIRFGVTSVMALAASAVINVPSVFYMFRSTRYEIKNEGSALDTLLEILKTDTTYSTTKLTIVMLVTALFTAFLLILFVNFKEHKRAAVFFLLSAAVLGIPVFFENINLIWHLGSYVGFPLRYAYMLIFILVCTAAYVLQNVKGVLFSINGKKNIALIVPAFICAAAGIAVLIKKVYNKVGTVDGLKYNKLVITDCEKWIFLSFVLLAVFYIMMLFIGNKKFASVCISVVLLCEIGLLANVSFGMNSDTTKRTSMYSLDFETDSLAMAEDLKLENDNLTRIKDMDVRLNSNFPMFFGYPSLSNFTHLVSSDMTSTMASLGYSQIYTRVIDSVGTLLSDALLNMQYTFSERDLDSFEYTYMHEIGSSHLYKNNFTLPIGLLVNGDFMNVDIVKNNDVFKSNNELYTALTGDSSPLCTTEKFILKTDDVFDETVHVDGTKHAYLLVDIENTNQNRGAVIITIDEKKADLTYFGSDINFNYPNNFHNELIDLGVRKDEDIQIGIFQLKDVDADIPVTVGYFDYTKLASLCELNKDKHAQVETKAKSLKATATAQDDDTYMFLPITYDEGWTCRLNGEKVDIDISMSSFMAVKLQKGENVIEMSYLPHGMKTGAVISIVTLLIALAIYILEKKRPFANDADNMFLRVFEKLYFAGMICVFVAIYIIPIGFTTFSNIK